MVMGMDQHRAQISAEWIDTITGEVSRARVAPGDRAGVGKFLARFAGGDLEVALEATTGWRFVVEELQRIGAEVHLAEPTETSGLRGEKQRAKTDWADVRHQRELLLIGRLPESSIPPAHILDLRARVRTRHTLSQQRTEWQQRMQAVLYHHGFPQRRDLLTLAKREWLAGLKLPAAAREQITISLHMIDAIDLQLVPFDMNLRVCAQAAGLPRVDRSGLRRRRPDRDHDSRRARRHPPVSELPGRGPLLGPGHHRLPIRRAPRTRSSLPPRPTGAALGTVGGCATRQVPDQSRPRTTSRPQSGSAATVRASR